MRINPIQFNFVQNKPQNTVNRPLRMNNGLMTDVVSFTGTDKQEKTKKKLVIEVDGFQHELDPEVKLHDENRTQYLSEQGIFVFRIKNAEINKTNFGTGLT